MRDWGEFSINCSNCSPVWSRDATPQLLLQPVLADTQLLWQGPGEPQIHPKGWASSWRPFPTLGIPSSQGTAPLHVVLGRVWGQDRAMAGVNLNFRAPAELHTQSQPRAVFPCPHLSQQRHSSGGTTSISLPGGAAQAWLGWSRTFHRPIPRCFCAQSCFVLF